MLTIPLMRPLILKVGSPELFMISLVGITLIGTLSGRSPFVGVALGLFGVLISMIGQDPQTGYYRWTFAELYLLDGLPLIPSVLGLFALTELIDVLGKGKSSVASGTSENISRDIFKGTRDALRNIPLIIKCAGIGLYVGAIPGLGGSVADWMAYAFAKQSVKDASRWGEGDVRAVIAPDAATNAKSSGSLMTTVSFGIPGDAPMIIIMSGLLALGITPGPKMFTDHLNETLTMVWTLVFANILGAAILMIGIRFFAKIAYANLNLLAPFLICLVFLSAYLCTAHIGDLVTLMIFTVIGVVLKKTGLPRPPLVLGLILGPIIARYLFITVSLYGAEWVKLPSVIVFAVIIVLVIVQTARRQKKQIITEQKGAST
jgi:TctA family transporter